MQYQVGERYRIVDLQAEDDMWGIKEHLIGERGLVTYHDGCDCCYLKMDNEVLLVRHRKFAGNTTEEDPEGTCFLSGIVLEPDLPDTPEMLAFLEWDQEGDP